MKRDSFIFYRSFMEAMSDLPAKEYKVVMEAIQKYAFNEEEPNLTGVAKVVFTLVKPQIQANNTRYKNGCQGGRPSNQTPIESKPNENQIITEEKPNENQNMQKYNHNETKPKPNDNVNDNLNENDNFIYINNKKEIKAEDAKIFEDVLNDVKKIMSFVSYESFFKSLSFMGPYKDKLIIASPSNLMSESIDRHYGDALNNAIIENSKGKFNGYVWSKE